MTAPDADLQAENARLLEALERISLIAHGRDHYDAFPRSKDEKNRRLVEISVTARAALNAPDMKGK